MKKKREKILVAMSGGVDSSVAAALLLKQGYEVTGAFMVQAPSFGLRLASQTSPAGLRLASQTSPAGLRLASQTSPAGLRLASSGNEFTGRSEAKAFTGRSEAEPCWKSDYQDAVRVAAKLGIPLLKLDFTKEYKKMVLDYMFREYRAGRTPNPDVLCNKFIKFGAWLKAAKKLGFDKLATGHYARLRREILNPKSEIRNKSKIQNPNKFQVTSFKLQVAKDSNKDQTYFLHQLTQAQLKCVLFPLGDYTKPEVRKMAKKWGLPTAEKEESMGICFVGEVDMKKFLQTKIKSKPGDIVFDGKIIGKHDGSAFYTIGQRIGIMNYVRQRRISLWLKLRIKNASTKPVFVVDKNIKKNQLIVGFENDKLLYKKQISVIRVNWISGYPPKLSLKCLVRLRHCQPLQSCVIKKVGTGPASTAGRRDLSVQFANPQRAVTPGQFAVFYKEKKSLQGAAPSGDGAKTCLGGGVIR